jgi:hypothetical protein
MGLFLKTPAEADLKAAIDHMITFKDVKVARNK